MLNPIFNKLSQHNPELLKDTPHCAAVLIILLTNAENDIEIVITKRTETLATFPGQYSFPGGMREENDCLNLYTTAQRETQEELHLPFESYHRIAQLDDFQDRYGNLVRPFVVSMKKIDFENIYRINEDEVAEIYYFPLKKLNEIKDDPSLHEITRRRPSYAFKEGHVFIWGLTANVLVHLQNIIEDKHQSLGKTIK